MQFRVLPSQPLGDMSNTVESRQISVQSDEDFPENISEAEADEGVPSLVHLLSDDFPLNKQYFEGSHGSMSERQDTLN